MKSPLPDLLGFHCDLFEDGMESGRGRVEELAATHTRTFQVYAAADRPFSLPDRKTVMVISALSKLGLNMVIHCPFSVNTNRDNPATWSFTKRFIFELYIQLTELGTPNLPFVLHTGKPDKALTEEQISTNFHRFVDEVHAMLTQYKLTANICIETDASPRSKWTQLDGIAEVLYQNSPFFGITLDTEHSYASGRHPSHHIPDHIWDMIKVVHLNGIPPEVEFGGGLDRHSETKLEDSKDIFYISPIFQEAVRRKLPIILERNNLPCVEADFDYLDQYC